MIAAWGLYCVVVGVLLALAARAAEGALGVYGRPARWVWAAALVGSLAIPLGSWLGWRWGAELAAPAEPGAFGLLDAAPIVIELSASRAAGLLDRPLLAVWLLGSMVTLAVVLAALVRLRRARAGWRPAVVDGRPVLVSDDVGPAALGVVRGAIVVPGWALALEERLRRLMLLHEEEHLAAGDPRLLLAGLLAIAAMPWNPALWWQFRRLRQALELDCDARVLRRVSDARSYGALLLEVGRRRCGGGLVVAALSEPRTFLERRIRMLAKGNPRMRPGRAALGAVAAAGLAVWACEAPEPTRTVESIEAPAAQRLVRVAEVTPAAGLDCTPVVFVDGAQVSESARGAMGRGILEELSPDAIARIEVVKGRAAAVLVAREAPGSDASCGAIMITTKAAESPAADGGVMPRRAQVEAVARAASADGYAPFSPEMERPDLLNRAEVAGAFETNYPPLLRNAGIGGTVNVLFWIDETGEVTRKQVDGASGHPALDEAALKIAEIMRFAPARKGTEPVKVVVAIPVNFRTP